MEKWNTIHQMGTQLCKDDVASPGNEINIATANRICKLVCIHVVKYGGINRKALGATLFYDPKLGHVNITQTNRVIEMMEKWFKWYWFPLSRIRRRSKNLIAKYK